MSQRTNKIKIYTTEDVARHNTAKDCWVIHSGKVYNVTEFLQDHPGGDDLILNWAGKDVGMAMKDPDEHDHSSSAYDMLSEYLVGKLGTEATIVSEDWVAAEDFHPDDTNEADDFDKCQFLDLRKPLLKQIWFSNFSKSFYLQQVHQPRHVATSAQLFGPWYLEMFTLTAWYVVPLFWAPIASFLFLRSAAQFAGPVPEVSDIFFNFDALPGRIAGLPGTLGAIPIECYYTTFACFLAGNFIWTLLEYGFHRFLFHVDELLPDRPVWLMLHFLMHGVHHYLPMDRMRLVMPPPLFGALQAPMTKLAHAIFPTPVANGIISGAFTFYILYDCMHYALHHTKLPAYLREMKKYHLAHHYKNFELGFGVTSKIWDIVFGTALRV
jgi:4-hydroxysphinganine ceramide fatty acyl 2-hydroxylase